MTAGRIIISLDFELHWGRFDKYGLAPYLEYYQNTLDAIPRILTLFEENGIHATWATVGSLMAENREEWETFAPRKLPEFRREKFAGVQWYRDSDIQAELGLFSPHLVRQILDTPFQELGSHTYTHYYTAIEGADTESFGEELLSSKRIARDKFGVDLKSLVFPRNQYDGAYLKTAYEAGYEVARINPRDWFWKASSTDSLLKRIFRTGDTLIPIGYRSSFDLTHTNTDQIVKIPASRLLRPYRENSIFNEKRISRIKAEIDRACAMGEAYHLWWHPHNFGHLPEENIKVLGNLLNFVRNKIESGQLVSQTMYEFANSLDKISSESREGARFGANK